MKKTLLLLLFSLFITGTLSACGKMSAPKPMEGSGYPHSYPRQ